MNNPLFNMLGGQMNQHPMMQMMQRFQQFRQNFRGDPGQQIQQMLNSGKISQGQYNQAVNLAQQLQRMMGGK